MKIKGKNLSERPTGLIHKNKEQQQSVVNTL